MNQTAVQHYRSVGLQTGLTDASSHRLVGMLLAGALERIAMARGAIERGDARQKGELIGKAISIVDGLRASVDADRGGEIAANLMALYDYIEQTLLRANLDSDAALLDEAGALLQQIKGGWDSIPESARAAS